MVGPGSHAGLSGAIGRGFDGFGISEYAYYKAMSDDISIGPNGLEIIVVPPTPTTKIDITDKITEEMGYELLPNTEFADTTDITSNNATLSVLTNELTVTAEGTESRGVEIIDTDVGSVYELTIEGFGGTEVGTVDIVAGSVLDSAVTLDPVLSTTFATGSFSSFTGRFVATESTMKIMMGSTFDFAKFTAPTVKKVTTIIDRNPIRAALGGLPGGDELVTGGDFSTPSDWVLASGWAINGNTAIASDLATTQYNRISQPLPTEIGKTYRISGDCINSDTYGVYLRKPQDASVSDLSFRIVEVGHFEFTVTVGSDNNELAFAKFNQASDTRITNISVKEVQPIRTEITVKDWVPGVDSESMPAGTSSILSANNIIERLIYFQPGLTDVQVNSYIGTGSSSSFTISTVAGDSIDIVVKAGNQSDMLLPNGAPYDGLEDGSYYQIGYSKNNASFMYGSARTFEGILPIGDWLTIPYGTSSIPMTYGGIQIRDIGTSLISLDVDFKNPARDNWMLEV